MIAWLSWLFEPKADAEPQTPREELRELKLRRRALLDSMSSLRAYGFDEAAGDDEQALRAIDRRILTLQLQRGPARRSRVTGP